MNSTKVTSKMKLVEKPVPGKLYAVGSVLLSQDDAQVELVEVLSERVDHGVFEDDDAVGGFSYTKREVLKDLPGGSVIFYVGSWGPDFHKVGVEDVFGLIEVGAVHFYDLGEP